MSTSNHLLYLLIAVVIFSLATICLGINSESVEMNNNNIKSSTSIFNYSFQKEEELLPAKDKILAKEGKEKTQKIKVIITAYSSEIGQTDDTPLITANGTTVKDGIVANNMLPFGTRIKIPELYGNKEFVVADRMHPRKGNYKVDIWFDSMQEAIDFGVKETYIEVSQI
jgi:3D (Asp-Asp-Asp) domain-containing protein